ncbi:MAG: hypothetical protein ACTSP3_17370 [Candidatus Heimdallarchaeaceae archaeon]
MKQIEIESLYKIYTGKVETVALEDFNEKIKKGEIVAVAHFTFLSRWSFTPN